jgi:hypothetical protein
MAVQVFGDSCTVVHYNILFIQSGSTVFFGYNNVGKREKYNGPHCIQIQYRTGVTFGSIGTTKYLFFSLLSFGAFLFNIYIYIYPYYG